MWKFIWYIGIFYWYTNDELKFAYASNTFLSACNDRRFILYRHAAVNCRFTVMQPVMNVNWPPSTLQMEERVRVQAAVVLWKCQWNYYRHNMYTLLSDETLLGKPLLLVHRVILIVEYFGTHYMKFFVQMWFTFRHLILINITFEKWWLYGSYVYLAVLSVERLFNIVAGLEMYWDSTLSLKENYTHLYWEL